MRAARSAAALLVTAFALALMQSTAGAVPLQFQPCSPGAEVECAKLSVPADRSHPGAMIQLSVERRESVLGASHSANAVLALAGGPGQAALPLLEGFRQLLGPALRGRDLLVIDQRGTGSSDPLTCAAAEGRAHGTEQQQIEQCAQESSERGSFTSAESVQDIEALRLAAGYSKLTLYGTSYGTKVALNYAEAFPSNVEAMLLDSVVPAQGEEAFHLHSFGALRGALGELCRRACRFARNPVGDVAAFNRRWSQHPLSGRYIDGRGRRRAVSINESGLWSLLAAGDLNPVVRAMLPGAIHAAVHGDSAPILHLWALANGLIPSASGGGGSQSAVNTVLFLTTLCNETSFPWSPGSSYSGRLEQAAAQLFFGTPESAFYPFNAGAAWQAAIVPFCAAWPGAGSAATTLRPLPAVPTLILSGGQDLRTPTVDARAVAARIPGSQVLVVPFVGHSVLGSDFSGCAQRAVGQFFAGYRVSRCRTSRRIVPLAAPPSSTRGLSGRSRATRTLAAAISSLTYLSYDELASAVAGSLVNGSRFGGLRGGFAVLSGRYELHAYSVVGGVTLTGALRPGRGGLLRVAGRGAAGGTLHVTRTRTYGVLGGTAVSARNPGSRAIITAFGGISGIPSRLPGPQIP